MSDRNGWAGGERPTLSILSSAVSAHNSNDLHFLQYEMYEPTIWHYRGGYQKINGYATYKISIQIFP